MDENIYSVERVYSVELTEPNAGILVVLVDEKIRFYKGIIEKTRRFPSETVSSYNTRTRCSAAIAELEYIREKLFENAS